MPPYASLFRSNKSGTPSHYLTTQARSAPISAFGGLIFLPSIVASLPLRKFVGSSYTPKRPADSFFGKTAQSPRLHHTATGFTTVLQDVTYQDRSVVVEDEQGRGPPLTSLLSTSLMYFPHRGTIDLNLFLSPIVAHSHVQTWDMLAPEARRINILLVQSDDPFYERASVCLQIWHHIFSVASTPYKFPQPMYSSN
jgi:hypothetical protein